jgi:3,4-dihydroxy 2-butanone 4-phosphate synthase / GTP cyclohydrolase II
VSRVCFLYSQATPENIGFIVRHTSGVLCVSLEQKRLDALKLPPMVLNNEDPKETAYTISVDCKHNTSTGISAADRSVTFRALADPLMQASDFNRPGHVFPLRYKKGGVLTRAGHTEASLDVTRLAGLNPCGVLAEVVHDKGDVMRLDSLKDFAKTHNLVLISVQDLIAYRYEREVKG